MIPCNDPLHQGQTLSNSCFGDVLAPTTNLTASHTTTNSHSRKDLLYRYTIKADTSTPATTMLLLRFPEPCEGANDFNLPRRFYD